MNSDRRAKYGGQGFSVVKSDKELDINLDVRTLDIMCKCLVSENQNIRRGQLVNLRNLIYLIKKENYINDPEKVKRINFIKKGIEARLLKNLTNPFCIVSYIYGGIIDGEVVNLDEFKGLSNAEVEWVNSMVSESLKYIHVYNNVDKMMAICTKFKSADFGSKSDIVAEFSQAVNDIQNEFRRANNDSQTEIMFSLRDEYFEDVMIDTYNTLSSPRRKLITGMQGVNELLGGGFENGRCYMFFGLPAEGKSSVILNIIYQIKKYNRFYRTKDPTKRPCIVLLTMENTVTESVERLFGMATGRHSMVDMSYQDAIKAFREEGELYLTNDSPIDIIIKFKPSLSVDTSYLYTLTEDLEDQGLEVIAMFQDYIGRIRSTERFQDTRLEYGAISDEFKTYAEIKDVPVISVAQLNRDASRHIDEGRKASKSDLVRLIGRSNISESMLILNNIDAGFLIAPEMTKSGDRYLGIQRIKIRYRAGNTEFVYIPYVGDTIKMEEDYGGIATYKTSMQNDSDVQYSGSPNCRPSNFPINPIHTMGMTVSGDGEGNIFHNNPSSDLDIIASSEVPPVPKLIDPFVHY